MEKRRECSEIIKKMLKLIPKEYQGFIDDLMWNYEDACYKAPEETIQWIRVSETLQKHIIKLEHDWQSEVLSIFSGIPVEEIKIKWE